MTSAHTGHVDIKICGKEARLRYDWAAISAIMTKHGNDVLVNLLHATPAVVADVLAAGLKESGITAADIMGDSPPILPLIGHIDRAMEFSYYGPDGAPTRQSADNKKKTA